MAAGEGEVVLQCCHLNSCVRPMPTLLPPSFTPLYLGHPQLLLQALQMPPQRSCLVLSRRPPALLALH